MTDRGPRGVRGPPPLTGQAGQAPKPPALPVQRPAAPRAIPAMNWSSAPPPIPPRSFSTEPPPPTPEPLTPVYGEDDERTKVDMVRQADALREEARALVRGMVEEALAPIHYAMRDLQRRIEALEARPVAPPPPPEPTPAPPPRAAAPQMQTPPAPQVAPSTMFLPPEPQRAAPAPIAPAPAPASVAFRPRIESVDIGVPFDGARRRRRVVLFFALVVLVLFGGIFAAMIWSRVR